MRMDAEHSAAPGLVNGLLVDQAFELARPALGALLQYPGASGEQVLHIIVMDPTAAPALDGVVLRERSIGDPQRWGADYRGYALAKARLSWREQRDSAVIVDQLPHRLRSHDTLLGGAIYRDGLVIAASGAEPWIDAACCGVLAELLVALARHKVRRLRAAGALALSLA
jgi:hypothetical protein